MGCVAEVKSGRDATYKKKFFRWGPESWQNKHSHSRMVAVTYASLQLSQLNGVEVIDADYSMISSVTGVWASLYPVLALVAGSQQK